MSTVGRIVNKTTGDQREAAVFDPDSYQPTPVVYQLRASILQRVRRGEDPLPEIDGREEAKKDVTRALLSGSHPYLVSEEGTGKTRLARAITGLLPDVPIIKGCTYYDDPLWPPERLCPRCRASRDPMREFGVEFVSGEKRFSRIQGNEYTNEAKLLGLKDIQEIVKGRSPADPQVFTGTGVFRANRGVLFVDELPAIRTKVQVLLHPILEEMKTVLEEYNWEHPLDLVLIATGNPQGFAHVNEVPRPLLDRLELIYMDLPTEDVERSIMLKERFTVEDDYYGAKGDRRAPLELAREYVERHVVAPWWILETLNKSVRYSRVCSRIDRKASIRGTKRAIDHTCSSTELENRVVSNLDDTCSGLKLALRSRIGLSPDYVDFENPQKTFERTDETVEDVLRNGLEQLGQTLYEAVFREDEDNLVREMDALLSNSKDGWADELEGYPHLQRAVEWMTRVAPEKVDSDLLTKAEGALFFHPEEAGPKVRQEHNRSAVEMLINTAVCRGLVEETKARARVFVPKRFPQRAVR